MKILQAAPGRSYIAHAIEFNQAIQNVLDSGWYILGKSVQKFEEEFSQYIGTRYAVGVANGTDALELILRGLGIGYGDKVATVGNTAVATVSAIERCGAEVRFADIDIHTFTMSPNSLSNLLETEKGIKAVIVVHLFGAPVAWDELALVAEKHGVPLIEDCAQAHGANYRGRKCGTLGIAAGFSFYPTKNLGAFGDGGAITTNNIELYQRIIKLRQYGWGERYISISAGINSRLDELQAAILSVKLPLLEEANERRRNIAACYRDGLKNVAEIMLPEEYKNRYHVYHQFVIQMESEIRSALVAYLSQHGIRTAIHYPVCIPEQPAYLHIPRPISLINTLNINSRILSLPIYPELSDEEIHFVISSIRDFFK